MSRKKGRAVAVVAQRDSAAVSASAAVGTSCAPVYRQQQVVSMHGDDEIPYATRPCLSDAARRRVKQLEIKIFLWRPVLILVLEIGMLNYDDQYHMLCMCHHSKLAFLAFKGG